MIFVPEWNDRQNALVEGENNEIMKTLLDRGYKEQFQMIYFDGPFNSGLLFSATQPEFGFEYIYPWSQYNTIQNYFHPSRYLEQYRQQIEAAKPLLREDGIFVLQTNMMNGHHIKVLLDDIFGRENFQSEVIWKHSQDPWPSIWGFPVGYQHETILFYSKSARFSERIDHESVFPSVWDDISGYQYAEEEETHYPSQKPQKLLERILDITTREGDLVGDFYCGSGTLPYAAEKKGRKWLACDNNPFSIQITKDRLSQIDASFETYYTIDEFEPRYLNGTEYRKETHTPVSRRELQPLPQQTAGVDVSAYSFLSDVDLINDKQPFTFYYRFPLVTPEGISESQTVNVARPIPVKDGDEIRLLVPDPLQWVMYHMIFLERNYLNMLNVSRYDTDCKQIFRWDDAVHRAAKILEQIEGNWITSAAKQDGLTILTDLFGYKYSVAG